MSDEHFGEHFGEQLDELFEEQLRQVAAGFQYPPTPDVAGAVSRRLAADTGPGAGVRERPRRARLAWALATVLVLLAVLAAVPQVRAAVAEFFQIGAIRLFVDEPKPTPPAVASPVTAPLGDAGIALPNLSGETTLEGAERAIGRQLSLPAYPAGSGPPDKVFVQEIGLPVAILVWLDRPGSEDVRLSLHVLPSTGGPFGVKSDIDLLEMAEVNGQEAYWVTGSHFLEFFDAQGRAVFDSIRLVEGNVLIWTDADLTYRLETDMTLEEAIRTAESLR